MLNRRLLKSRTNNGSISLFAVLIAGSMFLFIGMVWDGGNTVDGRRAANQLAAEAGRTAAQCVDVNAFLATGQATIHDDATALNCAKPYETLMNTSSPANNYTVTVDSIVLSAGNTTMDVQVSVYKPVLFLSAFGFTGHYIGHATVKLTQGVINSGG